MKTSTMKFHVANVAEHCKPDTRCIWHVKDEHGYSVAAFDDEREAHAECERRNPTQWDKTRTRTIDPVTMDANATDANKRPRTYCDDCPVDVDALLVALGNTPLTPSQVNQIIANVAKHEDNPQRLMKLRQTLATRQTERLIKTSKKGKR